MATVTDVEVANASFPTVRQDLNDILEAIATNFSADAEPTTTYANQWWYETDTNKLYIRNEDNDAWIHVLTLDQTTDTVSSVEGVSADAISEGNSSVEVIDSGTGYVQINVDGAEVARLDSNGLGVGTSSPDTLLQVQDTSGNPTLSITSGTSGASILQMGDTADLDAGKIQYTNSTNAMIFTTNASEAMRIDSSGRVIIDATSHITTGGFNPIVNVDAQTKNAAFFRQNSGIGVTGFQTGGVTGPQNICYFINGAGGVLGSISTSNGNTGTSVSYNTSSDYRLKEDWVPMSDSIARVKALNPVNFAWKVDGTRVDGFLAHEAQEVVPEAVTGTKDGMRTEEYEVSPALGEIYVPATEDADEQIISSDVERPETLEEGQEWRETTPAVMGEREVPDYQGIDQAKLIPLLTGALQEAIAKIEALEARVEALES